MLIRLSIALIRGVRGPEDVILNCRTLDVVYLTLEDYIQSQSSKQKSVNHTLRVPLVIIVKDVPALYHRVRKTLLQSVTVFDRLLNLLRCLTFVNFCLPCATPEKWNSMGKCYRYMFEDWFQHQLESNFKDFSPTSSQKNFVIVASCPALGRFFDNDREALFQGNI